MKTTTTPFMSANPEQHMLFSVNAGIELNDAMDLAVCFISSAGGSIVEAEGEIGVHHAYLIAYALEFAQVLVESINRA